MKIKFVEYIFFIFVLFVMSVIVGKYVLTYVTGKDLSYNILRFLINRRNYSLIGSSSNISGNTYVLKMDGNNRWGLYDGDQLTSVYAVDNEYNKVQIVDNSGNRLSVNISGVNDYYDPKGAVVTDIPYTFDSGSKFYVREQEDYLPIIGYHNVFSNSDDINDPHIDMLVGKFTSQINILDSKVGCQWLKLSDVVENYLKLDKKLPRNACVLTFDDGRKNNHDIVLPILKHDKIEATFFIISGRIGQRSYMNHWDISDLYVSGNEIGSHSLTGGSLVDTTWYKQGPFGATELWQQISDSRKLLQSFGYKPDIFAYPLGDYDASIREDIKKAGYVAARATKKGSSWKDPRAITTGLNDDYLWQLNYYEPELMYDNEIVRDISYTGNWQFEEGYDVVSDDNHNVRVLSDTKPTPLSFGVVELPDEGDKIKNVLVVSGGDYIINVFASTRSDQGNIFVSIDDTTLIVLERDQGSCMSYNNREYCYFSGQSHLNVGKHTVTTFSDDSQVILDSFKMSKEITPAPSYKVTIK